MKSNLLFPLSLAVLLSSAGSLCGDKSKLKWISFTEGVAEAKKSGKKVMIDVYTDWCGWCKRMDKDTYADGTVAEYLNKNYITIKLDAESAKRLQYRGQWYTERELAGAFGITGYPSIIFLQHDAEPITVYPGYADASKFKIVLSYIAEDHYKTMQFQDYAQTRQ